MRRGGRELRLGRGHDLGVLSADGGGVGLLEDGPHQGGDRRLRGLRDTGKQVAMVMGSAALPCRAGQHRGDRVAQPLVAVGGDQLHAGQAAGDQAAERQPPGAVLGGGDVDAGNLALAAGGRRRPMPDVKLGQRRSLAG